MDYRGLNAKTDRPIYPNSASEEIFDAIREAKYFSTLDLSSGYYQIPIKSVDMKKRSLQQNMDSSNLQECLLVYALLLPPSRK